MSQRIVTYVSVLRRFRELIRQDLHRIILRFRRYEKQFIRQQNVIYVLR